MAQQRYTPEMAVDLSIASDVQMSPDGSWIAFCVAPIGHADTIPTSTIFVVPANGSAQPRPITDSDHNSTWPRWSPDSTTLVYLSDRSERGKQQVYRIAATGGEPTRLTDLDGGAERPAWSRDGREVLFTARRRALDGKPEPDSEVKVASEEARPRAVAVVAATGGDVRVVGPRHGHVWAFDESPDRRRIAAIVSPTNLLDDTADRTWLTIWPRDDLRAVEPLTSFMRHTEVVQWSPDGQSILTLASRRPDHVYDHIHLVNVESHDVTTFEDRDLSPYWEGYAGNKLLAINVEFQRTFVDRMNEDGSWERLKIGNQGRQRWIPGPVSSNLDGTRHAYLGATPTRPPDVYAVDANGDERRLTDLNPQLDSVNLADMEEIIWHGNGDLPIHGWLLRPPGSDPDERLPLIVNVHGGPSMAWGNWFHGTWHDWGQILAANGYAVFLPNPRGSTGKGQVFTSANQNDLGGEDFEDVIHGIQELIERGVADSHRIGIGGWSYGGFLTAMAVVRTNRFRAAVAGAAVTNWPSKVGTTDIRPFNESNFPAPLHQKPDPFWIRSPVRYLKNAKTPTLVVHGEADPRVPVSQGMEFYLGLKAMGVDTDFVRYPRQKHAFHERAFQLDLLQRIVAWFDKYMDKDNGSGNDAPA
ncbi:MAG: S9 family peptidase [Thermomicrobiales bacterium]